MTREEAIKHIITYAYYEDDIPLQVSTALDMAISALRAKQERESNEPLTLDELRQMKGEPVWITPAKESEHIPVPEQWTIFAGMSEDINKNKVYVFSTTRTTLAYTSESYGQTWLAYRHQLKNTTEG